MTKAGAVLLLFLGSVLVYSCNKDSGYKVDYKYEYFPTDTGHYVIYDVDSVTFDPFYTPSKVDTVHFQLKELTRSIFNDNLGRPTARIERYRRNDTTANWDIWNVWSATRTVTTAERYEDNMRFIKLVFPPFPTSNWSGNSFIDITDTIKWMSNWNYQMASLDVPYSINGYNFDSTLTVLCDSDQNYINYTYAQEVYAKHVGLVYRQWLHLTKNASATFPSQSNSGFIYTMKLHTYGAQ